MVDSFTTLKSINTQSKNTITIYHYTHWLLGLFIAADTKTKEKKNKQNIIKVFLPFTYSSLKDVFFSLIFFFLLFDSLLLCG